MKVPSCKFQLMRAVMGFSSSVLVTCILLVAATNLQAQLNLANDLHPGILPFNAIFLGADAGAMEGLTSNALTVSTSLPLTKSPKSFDFTKSAPHLAFFCRLEINEKAGGVIPVKFRLGGVKHWQDDLGRRD